MRGHDPVLLALCGLAVAVQLPLVPLACCDGRPKPKPIQVAPPEPATAVPEARPAAELEMLVARLQDELAQLREENAEQKKDLAALRRATHPVAREIGLWMNAHEEKHRVDKAQMRAWSDEVRRALVRVGEQQAAEAAAKIINQLLED